MEIRQGQGLQIGHSRPKAIKDEHLFNMRFTVINKLTGMDLTLSGLGEGGLQDMDRTRRAFWPPLGQH